MRAFEPQPQDLVLSVLGAHLPERDRRVWSGGLVRILGEFGFSTAAGRVALARLVGRGLLQRERDGRHIHYRITPRCAALLAEGDARILGLGRAPRDDAWTVLWHVIPEERRLDRGRLARRLRFLGFGSVQERTWIAAHDREREVAALLEELDLGRHAGMLVGRPAMSLDFTGVVERAWDLDALADRYRAFLADFRPHVDRVSALAAQERKAFLLRTRLVHSYREFPYLDPELPDGRTPLARQRRDAVTIFQRLYSELRPAAQRHFDAVVAA